ncbi:hypothetical protein LEP1GSC047_1279 [Leptospira inadai serovar Lyme str. 10]|uniref:Uncharacterized protein n=1 Tax=Leptospira inadai serovar Lyme str. 10 TaxID=1049790 RepID=V6HQX0_9LEPT|nr:hypothetical protein LEP1GSC047_1279 [Leptospira inadai serovar Lyme str. 10]
MRNKSHRNRPTNGKQFDHFEVKSFAFFAVREPRSIQLSGPLRGSTGVQRRDLRILPNLEVRYHGEDLARSIYKNGHHSCGSARDFNPTSSLKA